MFSFLRRLFGALSDPARMLERGDMAFLRGDFQRALAWYQLGLLQEPKLIDLYEKRGTVFLALKRHEEALADFEVVIAQHPDPTIGYHNRATLYQQMGKDEAALADYAQALQHTPDYLLAYSNRALLFARRGELDKAQADIQELETRGYPAEQLAKLKQKVDSLIAKPAADPTPGGTP